MKVKYKEGDIFSIPLGDGGYSICQVIWAPQGDYKKVFSFCVLKRKSKDSKIDFDNRNALELSDNGDTIKTIFTSVKKISNGEWSIIGHDSLTDKNKELLIFEISGDLHQGDDFIRKLAINEYSNFASMSVFGFELVKNILLSN